MKNNQIIIINTKEQKKVCRIIGDKKGKKGNEQRRK